MTELTLQQLLNFKVEPDNPDLFCPYCGQPLQPYAPPRAYMCNTRWGENQSTHGVLRGEELYLAVELHKLRTAVTTARNFASHCYKLICVSEGNWIHNPNAILDKLSSNAYAHIYQFARVLGEEPNFHELLRLKDGDKEELQEALRSEH
jgi:hypothetical protein